MAVESTLQNDTATSLDIVAATSQDDQDLIAQAFSQPSGSQEKFKKRWIEFDCQKGVHHGKWSTYEQGNRTRVKGGYIGGLGNVVSSGEYGRRRVEEFAKNHDCHYAERFKKDLDDSGIGGIAVEGWPSGRGNSGLSDGKGNSGEGRSDIHLT